MCLQKDMLNTADNYVLRVDGGMSQNNLMMQYLSDLLQVSVERPVIQETTVMGAAFLAGLQFGIYKSIDELKDLWKTDRVFEPLLRKEQADEEYNQWLKIIYKETS